MGGYEYEVTVTKAPSKRKFHPLRSIARIVFPACYKRRQSYVISHHSCNGPSFLHNFLPILEPFLLLDPRLVFIEDHILGRRQPSRDRSCHKIPSSMDELKTWLRSDSTKCDCDECAPWRYQVGKRNSHGKIRQGIISSRFAGPHNLTTAPRPQLSLRLYGQYETMQLVRHHASWLDRTYLSKTSKQENRNVLQLRSLLHVWKSNLIAQNLRTSMSSAQVLHLIALLNDTFFFGALPPHRNAISSGFAWLPDSERNCFGIGTFNALIGTQVLLHPTLYRHRGDLSDVDVRWRNRLGTILHELCHAFLKAYTCRSCPTHDDCIGTGGHGRAWQLLAAKMEEVASKVTGGFVDLGRWPSLLHDLGGHGRLPSAHDLETLRFGVRWDGDSEG